jgi:F-type H+-transporting ATPase subunit epsilon
MKTFALELLDSNGAERFDAVRQFVGADASGSFGVLAEHEPTVIVLRYGLARFEDADGKWRYLSLPGGTLRFADNRLVVAAVHYFLGDDRHALLEQLAAEMARSDSDIARAKATLTEIEHSLVRRLGELTGGAPLGAAS